MRNWNANHFTLIPKLFFHGFRKSLNRSAWQVYWFRTMWPMYILGTERNSFKKEEEKKESEACHWVAIQMLSDSALFLYVLGFAIAIFIVN